MIKNIIRVFLLLGTLFLINWVYQVFKKPTELMRILSPLNKKEQTTWKTYQSDFESNSTKVMTPRFLAAMADLESAGNPWANTYWRWRWTTDITKIYSPASSSVGLFQYTKGTFQDAKRFCIRFGKVAFDGSWFNPFSCWFNSLYTRLSASDSIEMTAARLQHYVTQITGSTRKKTTLKEKQRLAAVIHLCGLRKGKVFYKNNFAYNTINPCGSHSPSKYFTRIKMREKRFR